MRRPAIPPPNVLDKVIQAIDPVRAERRMRARLQLALAGAWQSARQDRRATKDWNPGQGSADDDNIPDLPTLRARSRDLQRTSPLSLGAINTNVTSAVGTGLALRATPNSEVLGLTKEQAKEWARAVEREFWFWAEDPASFDIEATSNFCQAQALGCRSALESGDVIALLPMVKRPGSAYSLKVQLVEADRLCNKDRAPDSEFLTAGIRRGQHGEPIAYQICKRHPDSYARGAKFEWIEVPAFGAKSGRRNVVHLFEKRRPGQTRGVPYLAPVIETLKQLAEYESAEIQAAVIAAMFTVFVKTERGQGLDLDAAGVSPSTNPASGDEVKLGQGAIIDLAKGESVEIANPGRPNASADVFLTALARQIGVALEIPYEVLVKHFTASYSAARAALLEAWRTFRCRRAWMASMFCQPIYEAWLEEAVAIGRVSAPGFFADPMVRRAWSQAEWIGDGPGQIDPLKEIEAAEKRIALSVSNHTIETLEMSGRDWSSVNRQLSEELAERRSGNTLPESSSSPAARPPSPPADDEETT